MTNHSTEPRSWGDPGTQSSEYPEPDPISGWFGILCDVCGSLLKEEDEKAEVIVKEGPNKGLRYIVHEPCYDRSTMEIA